ncbi:histidinol-phosphate transaminase [Ruminococcus sp. AF14-10]|nr:histidinol-phosphate transaminase [Ruminococcus sp. AF14-10]
MALSEKIQEKIRKVEPYVPGEQPQRKVIKLNTNENPYPPAKGVEETLRKMEPDRLRLYPDPTANALVSELAERYGLRKDQVFVGVGSDDVLSMCFLTFFNSDLPILFPDITYSFYKVWAELYRIPYECQPLDEEFHIRMEDYEKENGGIIFPNPNAPTSVGESLTMIEEILKKNQDSVVIIDEAYIDFADNTESAAALLDRYENLLVVQTFSKSRAMAGMRIGFAMGNPELIRRLNDAKYSFNSYTMNLPSILCGVEAVKDQAYFEKRVNQIKETRAWAAEEFEKLGFTYPGQEANFLFVTHPEYQACEIFAQLKEHDIYVRYFLEGKLKDYLRITIGTREEMEALFDTLKKIMSKEN